VGIGSTFTFVIDLEKKSNDQNTIKRHLNPVKKCYQKIMIKANQKRKIKRGISIEQIKKSLLLRRASFKAAGEEK
jgi:hypothetical protein